MVPSKRYKDNVDLIAGLLESLDFELDPALRDSSGDDRIARSSIVVRFPAERRALLHELERDVPSRRPPAFGQGADPSSGEVRGRQARC